jgi:phage terminase large subunit
MSLLNPNLRGFYETPGIRNHVLYGGRGSSKTYHTAAFCVFLSSQFKVRFLCVRQFQNRITDSVKTVIEECIYRAGIQDEFNITENTIEHKTTGSYFSFLGIQRNLKEIKGISGIDILWVEEAEDLTKDQWEILEPTIREEGSRIFIVFNPRYATDFVYQKFVLNPPPRTLVRKINYPENPFLSKTMLEVIAACKAESEEDYQHIYLGNPKEDTEGAVIKRSWIEAAIDAHLKLGFEAAGRRIIGFDVADDGEDACANVYAHGSVALWCEEWRAKEDELLKSCSRTFLNASERAAEIRYDCIGVGASAGAKFDELNQVRDKHLRINYAKFNAGAAVERPEEYYVSDRQDKIKNKDFFANLKAQTWWNIADRFRNTYNAINRGEKFKDDELISISSDMPHLEKLETELSTPKRDFDRNGRVKVESKEDLAKSTRPGGPVPSPNCFVAGTVVETPRGSVPIENLSVGDEVITPMGAARIIVRHVNQAEVISAFGLTGTPTHKIFTWNRGWCELRMLSSCDILESYHKWRHTWQIMNELFIAAKCSQFSTRVDTIAQAGTAGSTLAMSDFYTGGYGLTITARFLTAIQSITSTAIGAITRLKTLSASHFLSTPVCTCGSDSSRKNIAFKILNLLSWRKRPQRLGTPAKKDANGIANTGEVSQSVCHIRSMCASCAENHFFLEIQEDRRPALAHAEPLSKAQKQKSLASRSAGTVEPCLDIQNREEGIFTHSAPGNALQSRIIATVYNLTLDRHNAYYANGVLVKNCADAFVMAFAAPTTSRLNISDAVLKMAMRG